MSASALPVFTAPSQSIGQAPLKSGPEARSATSDDSFSRMFGQAQSKGQASGGSHSPAKKGGMDVPGGKALPPKAKVQQSEQPLSQSTSANQNLSQGDKGSTSQPAPVDTQATATQEQARATVAPEEARDASLASQLAAFGVVPTQPQPPVNSDILDEQVALDLNLLLQDAVGEAWSSDGLFVDTSAQNADALIDADTLLAQMAGQSREAVKTAPIESGQIQEAIPLDAMVGDQEQNQSQTLPQAPMDQEVWEPWRAQIATQEGPEQTEAQLSPEVGSLSNAEADLTLVSEAVSTPVRPQDSQQAEVSDSQGESTEVSSEISEAELSAAQARSAFFARMQAGNRRQKPEADEEAVVDKTPVGPRQTQAEQVQVDPQAATVAVQGQPVAAEPTGVSFRGQVNPSTGDRPAGKGMAQTQAAEVKAPGLMLDEASEVTAESDSREGRGEQAEGKLPESGHQEQVKNFSQLLNSGMTAVRSEPLTAARPQPAELPPHLRSLDTQVGSRAWEQGVGERIHWMIGNNLSSAEIRLNPQHLGPLEIRISLNNDQAQVSILAQHGVTREALEASLPRLREMFQDSNLNLGSVDVGRREAQSQQQGLNQQQGQGQEREREGRGRGFFDQGEDDLSGDSMMGQRRRVSTALIDDFA